MLLREETNFEPWTADRVRIKLAIHRTKLVAIGAGDLWKVEYLFKLLDERLQAIYNLDET